MPDELGAGADARTVDQMMQELLDREHASEPPPVEYEKYDAEGKPTAEFLRRNPRIATKMRQDAYAKEFEANRADEARMGIPPPVPVEPPLRMGKSQPVPMYDEMVRKGLVPPKAAPAPHVPLGPGGKPFAPAIKIGPNGEIIWPKE